jgi:hypothetical protein
MSITKKTSQKDMPSAAIGPPPFLSRHLDEKRSGLTQQVHCSLWSGIYT